MTFVAIDFDTANACRLGLTRHRCHPSLTPGTPLSRWAPVVKRPVERCAVHESGSGSRLGGHKNDYFALLYLAQEFKGKPIDYEQQVAFGGNDYGLDAFHIDRDARNLCRSTRSTTASSERRPPLTSAWTSPTTSGAG